MPGKVTRSVLIVRFGTVTQCFVILFSFLPAWLLSAAFCNALIQVDKLPDATQILASNQQQQKPPNSTESFEGLDYETRKCFNIPPKTVLFVLQNNNGIPVQISLLNPTLTRPSSAFGTIGQQLMPMTRTAPSLHVKLFPHSSLLNMSISRFSWTTTPARFSREEERGRKPSPIKAMSISVTVTSGGGEGKNTSLTSISPRTWVGLHASELTRMELGEETRTPLSFTVGSNYRFFLLLRTRTPGSLGSLF